MKKQYIDIPLFTTFQNITDKNYTLSATQYKSFQAENKNVKPVSEFLDRDLQRKDLGNEVGSESYLENSPYFFIKTKALQPESYLLDITKESIQNITPKNYVEMNLKQGDLLISKDSNVGEMVILDKDYPNTMLCGGIYRLPIAKNKYYLLAFIKSDVFRQQIDFLVPRGSTIRHGKTKFLDCMIPMPNKNSENSIKYVELLMQAIINKEIEIRKKHKEALDAIMEELQNNQKANEFQYEMPTLNEILKTDRLDSNRYCKEYKQFRFLITNYINGFSSISDFGYKSKRGQNLQVSAIGKSIYSDVFYKGFYNLILSKNLSKEGRILNNSFLGNVNQLDLLNEGDIVFSARGNLGRNCVVISNLDNFVTNIDNIIFYGNSDINKSCFLHLLFDLYRENDFLKKVGINGSGAESLTKYQIDDIPIPNFPAEKELEITKLYHNSNSIYETTDLKLDDFLNYDNNFNQEAGIYELDKTMKYLQEKLNKAINDIVDDIEVKIEF